MEPTSPSTKPTTHITFDQKEAAFKVGDHSWTVTRLRFKGFGDDKFRDISIDSLGQDFIEKAIAMMQGREADFADLSEFTFTIEEAFGLSAADFENGQKSHFFLDPRRITEKPTHQQLFNSGKLKCQICYLKNGREVNKKFMPKNEDEAKKFTEFTVALHNHRFHAEKEDENLPLIPPEKSKAKGKQEK